MAALQILTGLESGSGLRLALQRLATRISALRLRQKTAFGRFFDDCSSILVWPLVRPPFTGVSS